MAEKTITTCAITTQAGDGWDSLAKRLWGNERLMHHLMRANPTHMDVLVFPADVVLTVPSFGDSSVPVRRVNLELPPWM